MKLVFSIAVSGKCVSFTNSVNCTSIFILQQNQAAYLEKLMDFTAVLQIAKQNRDEVKDGGKYYKTKLAPPKKESKESRRLSENIRKFLQKREEEEKQKMLEQKKKVADLLAMRDEKSKNKIRKMLKVTKSANKSVLDDACSSTQTAVTLAGADQPDQDDYGYVSNEANAFYQKYIEKVKDVQDDKGFAPSRPQSIKDLTGTKERVKAAITREKDQKVNGERKRSKFSSESVTEKSSSAKNLYDPEAERKEEEKRREEERKKARRNRPAPPPMDFRELLKLAEKKQHEPIEIVQEVKKGPERLLTSKEKQKLEEQKRAKEARERRERDLKEGRIKPSTAPSTTTSTKVTATATATTTKPNVSASKPSSSTKSDDNKRRMSDSSTFKKPQTANSKTAVSSTTVSSKPNLPTTKPAAKVATRELPTKPSPSKPRPVETHNHKQNQKVAPKRRVIDDYDDEDEYDSEMDDFIDDGDAEIDYSSVIQNMFGYNRAKYRDLEDEDDIAMESNFAQVQREEYISNKIGLKEDLEEMRLEALHKERKMKKLKKSKLI